MRKQDRIAQEQQNQSQDSSKKDSQQPREREQMKGSASENKPARHPGDKLPLPE
jgi:hypothetical protein